MSNHIVILSMKQKKFANYNNLLLDNMNLPTDITLVSTKEVVTPSLLKNSPPESM